MRKVGDGFARSAAQGACKRSGSAADDQDGYWKRRAARYAALLHRAAPPLAKQRRLSTSCII